LCCALQLHASASTLQLVTFDADGTLYADGAHMAQVLHLQDTFPVCQWQKHPWQAIVQPICCSAHTRDGLSRALHDLQDNRMIQLIIDLMNLGVHVAIVTAAGYPGEAGRFEQRVQGLLAAFRQQRLPDHIVDRYCRFMHGWKRTVCPGDMLQRAAVHDRCCFKVCVNGGNQSALAECCSMTPCLPTAATVLDAPAQPEPSTWVPDSRFHMMGGECNYLLRVGPAPERRLQFVPDGQWKSEYMMGWRAADIEVVLDEAGALLQSTAAHLRLPVEVPPHVLRDSITFCVVTAPGLPLYSDAPLLPGLYMLFASVTSEDTTMPLSAWSGACVP
jgi:IMP-specific 5'-nucleotidase